MKSFLKSKKAGMELPAEETTELVFGVITFIIIVVVIAFVILSLSGEGKDSFCKLNAAMNGIMPGHRWRVAPNFFCHPKTVEINVRKDCDCTVFRQSEYEYKDCVDSKNQNKGVCEPLWQSRFLAYQVYRHSVRCWSMGSSGKLLTGDFGCFMIYVTNYDDVMNLVEIFDIGSNVYMPVSESEYKLLNEFLKENNINIKGKGHDKGNDVISSGTWVGISHCGVKENKIMIFNSGLASIIHGWMKSECPSELGWVVI